MVIVSTPTIAHKLYIEIVRDKIQPSNATTNLDNTISIGNNSNKNNKAINIGEAIFTKRKLNSNVFASFSPNQPHMADVFETENKQTQMRTSILKQLLWFTFDVRNSILDSVQSFIGEKYFYSQLHSASFEDFSLMYNYHGMMNFTMMRYFYAAFAASTIVGDKTHKKESKKTKNNSKNIDSKTYHRKLNIPFVTSKTVASNATTINTQSTASNNASNNNNNKLDEILLFESAFSEHAKIRIVLRNSDKPINLLTTR
jgi:hypothetical protein